MPSPAVAMEPDNIRERIIVALDVPSVAEARTIVNELSGAVGAFKVGLQLFTAGGPGFVRELSQAGTRVFLDLKFHDIPNTVAHAGVEVAKLGVWMFNIHASGGSEMIRQTVDSVERYCGLEGVEKPLILGVTVLTSSDDSTLRVTGVGSGVEDQVTRLAKLSAENGLDGVVASPREVNVVRTAVGAPGFRVVTPGIRSSSATTDDQRRVMSIGDALAAGSDYVVIGRPILAASDRLSAVEDLVREAGEAK